MEHSTVFTNAFANGTTSSYGLMSVLGGIPPFLDEPYFSSIYGSNKLKGIGNLLAEYGYTSSFFYGAEEDHYGFRKNMSLLGIDHYYSMKDYPGKDYDGHWGIYDGPFFQYAAAVLDEQEEPFFATIFNISSHFPYMVPVDLKEVLPKGRLLSHQSISYVDHSLREFFAFVKSKDWMAETLFVFIADHWAKMREMEDKSAVGIYRIPFFIYDPANPVKREIGMVAQHLDVIPTLLDHMNYSGPWMSFGRPAVSDTGYRFTFNEFENIYRLIDSSHVLAYDENSDMAFSLHNYGEDPMLGNNLLEIMPGKAREMEKYLHAVIQTYHNHLIDNDVFISPKAP